MAPLEMCVPAPKVRVLVADDAQVIIRTLAVILELGGYDACAVYSGLAALRLLNLFKPELVVTDVTATSTSSGDGTVPAVSSQGRCRVLLFTGHTDMHSLLRDEDKSGPSFELVLRPIREEDLLPKLTGTVCSDLPPLIIPIDLGEPTVH